jgi:hypothetical protein
MMLYLDEIINCFVCAANNLCAVLDCEYVCRSSLEGGACACPDGKKLANNSRTCIGNRITVL